MSCIAHYEGTNNTAIITLTDHSSSVLAESISTWRLLFKEPEKSICDSGNVCLSLVRKGATIHKSCYGRLTNKSRQGTAKHKYSELLVPVENDSKDTECSETEPPPAKTLRSSSGVKRSLQKPVLERICVICEKSTKYMSVKSMTKIDKLVQSSTKCAGRLLEVAQMKNDHRILIHFDRDAVANEMCYHSKCYRDYTRQRSDTHKSVESSCGTVESLPSRFCKEFEQRLFVKDQFLMMKDVIRLHNQYSDTQLERKRQIKPQLQQQYDNLIFEKSVRSNESEIVYAKDAKVSELQQGTIDCSSEEESNTEEHSTAISEFCNTSLPSLLVPECRLTTSRSRQSTTSSNLTHCTLGDSFNGESESEYHPNATLDQTTLNESECLDISDLAPITSFELTTPHTRKRRRCSGLDNTNSNTSNTSSSNLFYGSIELKDAINSHMFKPRWPPSSRNLNLETAESAVPPMLYNFLASTCGLADKNIPPNSLEFIKVPSSNHGKLLSICQDIVALHSRGRVITPKSLSLGITLKHRTGSSDLVRLLHSLGHCVSYDSVTRAETAIATDRLENPVTIPQCFSKAKLLILVYDNIDFVEETLSGAGTTHQMNGIMFQLNTTESDSSTNINHSTPVSRRARTINAKPQILDQYIQGKRCGMPISNASPTLPRSNDIEEDYNLQQFKYILAKTESPNLLPAWTGYQRQLCRKENELLQQSKLHYLNNIEAPPNDMSTVSYVLQQSVEKADDFELDAVVVVFDQALYSKAQQIRWKHVLYQKRLVLRMGEFHTCMAFMGAIGKMFKLSGLEDTLVEAEVVAQGSIAGVLGGRNYNRAIRAHKIMYESLARLQLQSFVESLDGVDREAYRNLADLIIKQNERAFCTPQLLEIQKRYADYIRSKSESSPMFAYWSTYVKTVEILLMFLRATRESDWDAHVYTLGLMLPFFFSLDRQNYARYGSAYWYEMTQLPSTHPEVYQMLCQKGSWTLQRCDRVPFSSVAADQAIEQTVNRDTKTAGGLKGVTLKRGAMQRWYLTQSERAAISGECERMGNMRRQDGAHSELTSRRMKKDELDVQTVMSTIESFINPFEYDGNDLVSLMSGIVATTKTRNDLSSVVDHGEKAKNEFLEQRIQSSSVDFFSPVKASKLSTFQQAKKKKTAQQAKADIQACDRSLFARLLVISRTRPIELELILSYPLCAVSVPLASADGSIAKTNKSILMQAIEADCQGCVIESVEDVGAIMVDAMAVIQALPISSIPATFGKLADTILELLISRAKRYHASRVDFIMDNYYHHSIKSSERNKRGDKKQQHHLHITNGEVKVPRDWKAYLKSGKNKEAMLEFLATYWQTTIKNISLILYTTTAKSCYRLCFSPNNLPVISEEPALATDHEEADTRLILHASHAATTYSQIIIESSDTDVAVMALAHSRSIPCRVALLIGKMERRRLLDITAMTSKLGENVCKSLIGLHAYSGCDAVSSFAGKGKKRHYKLIKTDVKCQQAMEALGNSFELTDRVISLCERYTCKLYGQDDGEDINKLRYSLFVSKSGASQSLPPCRESLIQHINRANYVAAIWKSANVGEIKAPPPTSHGWLLDEEQCEYIIKWHNGVVAPPDVLKTIACGCKKSLCKGGRCACSNSNLPCTELCSCTDCENCPKDDELAEDSDSEEEMEEVEADQGVI